MTSSIGSRLYGLAKRLSLGRILRYLDLWLRYFWRRSRSALKPSRVSSHGTGAEEQAAALAHANMASAMRIAVSSWFPLDLANKRLHRAMLLSVTETRADLGITPEIVDHLVLLKSADDLSARVDELAASGAAFSAINTALYMLLLRRLPAQTELSLRVTRGTRSLPSARALNIGNRGDAPYQPDRGRMLYIDVGNTVLGPASSGWCGRSPMSSRARPEAIRG
jgi:hypothetical protein